MTQYKIQTRKTLEKRWEKEKMFDTYCKITVGAMTASIICVILLIQNIFNAAIISTIIMISWAMSTGLVQIILTDYEYKEKKEQYIEIPKKKETKK